MRMIRSALARWLHGAAEALDPVSPLNLEPATLAAVDQYTASVRPLLGVSDVYRKHRVLTKVRRLYPTANPAALTAAVDAAFARRG